MNYLRTLKSIATKKVEKEGARSHFDRTIQQREAEISHLREVVRQKDAQLLQTQTELHQRSRPSTSNSKDRDVTTYVENNATFPPGEEGNRAYHLASQAWRGPLASAKVASPVDKEQEANDTVLEVLAHTLQQFQKKKRYATSDEETEEGLVANAGVKYSKKPGPLEDCSGFVPKLFPRVWFWARTIEDMLRRCGYERPYHPSLLEKMHLPLMQNTTPA